VVALGEVWLLLGRCGSSGGGVVARGEVWQLLGRCGSSWGGVVAREVCVVVLEIGMLRNLTSTTRTGFVLRPALLQTGNFVLKIQYVVSGHLCILVH
jgi:hypothetical protein